MGKKLLIIFAALLLLGILLRVSPNLKSYLAKLPNFSSPTTITNEIRSTISEENAVISSVEKTSPGVVAITVSSRVFNPFDPGQLPSQRQNTIGTGFVVSNGKGVIVTNRHVVSDPNAKYTVVTREGNRLDVAKIYRDPVVDMALLKVQSSNLPQLELGDSSKLKVGQTVIAIGNALGEFSNTVTTGVVSGLGRQVSAGDPFLGFEELENLIQTDAAINPGNSGGPLLNSAGQVIGVNVAVTEGAQNIGFAIPINAVKAVVDEFVSTGKISRPFLGVNYQIITRDLSILNNIPQGAYIQEVVPGSAAEESGLKQGDIITKINGQSIDSDHKLSDIISSKKVGDKITLEVWTDGKTRSIQATLKEVPQS